MKNQSLLNFITAFSLIASLVLVSVQINQSNHLSKAKVRQNINDNDIEFLKSYLDSEIVPLANLYMVI